MHADSESLPCGRHKKTGHACCESLPCATRIGDGTNVQGKRGIMEQKQCYTCCETRPTAEFYCDKAKKDGLSYECKGCLKRRQYAYRNWAGRLCDYARRRARKKALPFDITPAYLRTLFVKRCPALGVELFYGAGKGKDPAPNSASLDRISPGLGYVRGNVQIISLQANIIKGRLTPREMIWFGRWLNKCGKNARSL